MCVHGRLDKNICSIFIQNSQKVKMPMYLSKDNEETNYGIFHTMHFYSVIKGNKFQIGMDESPKNYTE